MKSICLDIIHYKTRIETTSHELIERLRRDFSIYFKEGETYNNVDLGIRIVQNAPARELSCLPFIKVFRNADHYDYENYRVLRYDSQHFVVMDFTKNYAQIFGVDTDTLHEITYLLILSRFGKSLDLKNCHRLHAACFVLEGKPFSLVLDSGVGKSTLSLKALSVAGAKFYSDDCVLVNVDGSLSPFHLRIGVSKKDELIHFEERYIYSIARKRYGLKWLLDLEAIKEKLAFESISSGNRLIFGRRDSRLSAPIVERISRISAFCQLIVPMVIGYGLPILLEYFWERGWKDMLIKTKIALSRTRSAWELVKKSDCYFVHFTDDSHKNIELIRRL